MKIKLGEETPLQLNWMVAKCEGYEYDSESGLLYKFKEPHFFKPYSNDWAQAGPIVERERIHLNYHGGFWNADDHKHKTQFDKSPLIAAMRCYVASKLGDEVELPPELA